MASKTEQRKIEIIADAKKADASIKDMRAGVALLNNQLNKLPKTSKEFAEKSKEFKQVKQNLKDVESEAKNINSTFDQIKTTLGPLAGAIGITFGVNKIFEFFTASSGAAKEFEKALSSLSSITGATGEDLEFYRREAELIGQTTTLSATQAVEAFKLIGSAKPDLLKNKEALAAVTQEAITLAEAAEIDLPSAAQAMAGALNQFQLPATESARVINALAAGSKEGAAAIPELTASIDKFGPAANSFNVSVEQSVGLVETLAEYNIKGAESGTALRNVLLKMSTAKALSPEAIAQMEKFGVNIDIVSDKSIPFNERLREFSKIGNDATAIAKVFGTENAIAGEIILKNVGKFEKYTKAVTGTNIAYEQAAINTNNLDGDMLSLGSATEALQISIGDGLNAALRPAIQLLTAMILGIKEAPKFIKENQDLFYALGAAILTMNAGNIVATASTIAHTAVEKGRAIATRATAISQQLLNAAMTANPIGLVIKAVALLGAGFVLLYNRSETVRQAVSGLASAAVQVFKNLRDSVMEYLGGIANILVGVFTLDVDKIKEGLSGAFNGLKDTYLGAGRGVADAYGKGYAEQEEKERAKREAKKGEEQQAEMQAEEAHTGELLALEEDKGEQLRQVAEEKQKELEQQREEFRQAELRAEKALQDLKVELIDDETDRKLAKLQLAHERELEQLEGNEQQKEEMRRLLEEQFRDERAEILEEQKAEQQEQEEEAFDMELEKLEEKEEGRRLTLENQFLQGLTTQQERDVAMLDLQQSFLQSKLALLEQAGLGETTQAQQLKNAILKIEQEKSDLIKKNDEELAAARKAIAQDGVAAAFEFMSLRADYAQQEADEKTTSIDRQIEALKAQEGGEEANAARIAELEQEKEQVRKEAAKKKQQLQIAQTIADGIREVASLWAGYASMGPVGVVLGAIQTGFAVARTALAVRNIRSQQYAEGGFTSPVSVDGSGRLVDSTGFAVAGVAHEGEWYAPKWMVDTPQYANVIGWLESERTRKFADGGYSSPASTPASGPQSPVSVEAMQQNMMMLTMKFDQYAAKVDQWARELKVFNDVRDTRDGLMTLNRIDEQSSIR